MKKFLIFVVLLTTLSCIDWKKSKQTATASTDQSYFRHLNYLLNIKNEVAQKYWADFAKKDFFAPLVYYSRENAFILNPNEHIRKITDRQQELFFNKVPYIQLPENNSDTSSLQFHVSITSDSTELAYMQPILYFQSFELTRKFIPDLIDIQDWSIMIIHELFHSYQWAIPEMLEYTKTV